MLWRRRQRADWKAEVERVKREQREAERRAHQDVIRLRAMKVEVESIVRRALP